MPNEIALVPSKATRVVELDGIIDGYPSETYALTTNIGTNPLEDGSSVTDHAVALPSSMQAEGTVRGIGRAEAAWSEMRRLHQLVETFTVVSPFGVFREMMLKSCNASRKGDGLEFQLEFEQVLRLGLTGSQVVEPVSGPATGRTDTVESGRQNLEPEPDPLESLENLPGEEGEEVEEAVAEEVEEEEEEEETPLTRRQRFKKALAKVTKAVGRVRNVLSDANAMRRAFESGGVLGLLSTMDDRLDLPPPFDDVGDYAKTAEMLAAAGRDGLQLARALDAAGADDLEIATRLSGASHSLGRRFLEELPL